MCAILKDTYLYRCSKRNPAELAHNLPALALDLDAATMAELERLTEPVKEALGRNLDMWSAKSRMR